MGVLLTLLDVLKLIKHYLRLSMFVVLACALIGVAFGCMKAYVGDESYSAEAVVTVSEPTGTIEAAELMPLIQAIATNALAEDAFIGEDIALESDSATHSITFVAEAPTMDESMTLANSAAIRAIELTKSTLAAQSFAGGDGYEADSDARQVTAFETVVFAMNDASQAVAKDEMKEIVRFGLFGLIGGIFLAVCFVLIIDKMKAPIRDRGLVEKEFGVPVLVEGPNDQMGERLWANVQFACEGTPSSICLIPLSDGRAQEVERQLLDAMRNSAQDGSALTVCAPLSEDVRTIYVAHDAEATLVLARTWRDSMDRLSDALQELSLAQANVVGVALMNA